MASNLASRGHSAFLASAKCLQHLTFEQFKLRRMKDSEVMEHWMVTAAKVEQHHSGSILCEDTVKLDEEIQHGACHLM